MRGLSPLEGAAVVFLSVGVAVLWMGILHMAGWL